MRTPWLTLAATMLLLLHTAAGRSACTLQWVWIGAVRAPNFPWTCVNPLVVQLTDDDGDGRIDACDVPDVVFNNCGSTGCVVTALDGQTGAEHFVTTPDLMKTAIAAGDIDGDGVVEIIGFSSSFDHLVA